jgi:hypothetical protein
MGEIGREGRLPPVKLIVAINADRRFRAARRSAAGQKRKRPGGRWVSKPLAGHESGQMRAGGASMLKLDELETVGRPRGADKARAGTPAIFSPFVCTENDP